ncbi:AAA family ATPase [Kitasatospora sp. RG8]|uniref:ATP-binding protein n=1 Tax=Kitasatospora sp. RG8 TaxID=2820815 RepID=UPI001ADFC613|nr:LuxR family transcriptional regulator [Kitasatospora sp. RG8]MBP0448705.1 AAA family ATPase [Kitasatospora sp. RG8]
MAVTVQGRETERTRIELMVRQLAAGTGQAVVLRGEPGIGKSAVLDLVDSLCRAAGITVLRGEAGEIDQSLPFAVLSECLDASPAEHPGVARIRGLLRGDERVSAPAGAVGQEFLVAEAILSTLDDWCSAEPLALLVDDLHWADPASLAVIRRLARALDQLPLLLVVAYRPAPEGAAIAGLLRDLEESGVRTTDLGPLAEAGVAALVADLTGGLPGERLRSLVAGAAGNPLYVAELIRDLSDAGRIELRGATAEISAEMSLVPATLSSTILHRLDTLSVPTREMLRVVALLGRAFSAAEMTAVLRLPATDLVEPVVEALAAGVLEERGSRLAFRHDLIRRAVVQSHSQAVRTALHEQIGASLAEAGAPVERVAEHVLEAGRLGRWDVAWLRASLDPLLVRAPALAVELLRRATADADATATATATATAGHGCRDLDFELVRALLWAGLPAEAERAAGAALARPLPIDREGTVRGWLAQAVLEQGRLEDTVAEVRSALALEGLPQNQAARLHAVQAQALHFMSRMEESEAAALLAVRHGRESGDTFATAYGLTTQAAVLVVTGRVDEALALTTEALDSLGATGISSDFQLSPHLARGYCLADLDRLAEAHAHLRTGARESERAGVALLTGYQSAIAKVEFLRGNWDDALVAVQSGLDTIDPLNIGPDLHAVAALIEVRRDQRSEHTDAVVNASEGRPARSHTAYLHWWARALVKDAEGDCVRAFELLESYLWASGVLRKVVTLDHLFPDAARMAFCLGRADRLAALAESAQEAADFQPSPNKLGTAALCRGLAEADNSLLAESATAYHAAGRPLFAAFARENEAVLLARAGLPDRAGTAMAEAVDGYLALGATWDARRTRQRLRAEGLTVRSRQAVAGCGTGWEALSATERAVLALVAEGCSNPQIAERLYMSRRTVQLHVSRVMAKLGESSRVGLAVTAALRQPR